jgi:hypothetical protein
MTIPIVIALRATTSPIISQWAGRYSARSATRPLPHLVAVFIRTCGMRQRNMSQAPADSSARSTERRTSTSGAFVTIARAGQTATIGSASGASASGAAA